MEAESGSEVKSESDRSGGGLNSPPDFKCPPTEVSRLLPGACGVADDLVECRIAQPFSDNCPETLHHRFAGHLHSVGERQDDLRSGDDQGIAGQDRKESEKWSR